MSGFYLFSPEQSEIETDEEIRVDYPKSESYTPLSIPKLQSKPALRKHKPRLRKAHPSYAVMVDEAVFNKGVVRKGLSLFAVKKFMKEKYDLDMKYASRRIKSVIKDGLEKGRYVKTSGRGLTGRFRLSGNTRRILKTKYSPNPTKSLRITFKTKKHDEKAQRKRKNKDKKNNEMASSSRNRKRKANPKDVPKGDEIKKSRTDGPARMRAKN